MDKAKSLPGLMLLRKFMVTLPTSLKLYDGLPRRQSPFIGVGICPHISRFSHPRWLKVRQGFGSHPWTSLQKVATRPSFWFYGGYPNIPQEGALPFSFSVFAHPRWLKVCQRFGPHSWAVCKSRLLAPSFNVLGAHPPSPLPWGFTPWTPLIFTHPRWLRATPRSLRPRGLGPKGLLAPRGSPASWVPLVASSPG